MIGQKFVYKFVSFPEILKMDPQAVEMGLASGRFPLPEEEASELEVEEDEEEEGEEETQRRLVALGAQQCRKDYLHSGLYSSFSISSLQNQPELLRALRERQEEPRSVIRFGERNSPPSAKPESYISSRVSGLRSTSSSPHAKPSGTARSWSPAVEQQEEGEEVEEEDSDPSSQPLNLSSGHRERALQPPERSSDRGKRGDELPPKNKKPKALEISSPSLLLAGSDIGSIALNSPALPSGSLTPAFFTAQVRSDGVSLR